ncbi:MFS transporter [Streptomyces sp. NPDC057543]|uniref:MFS transporter n=1 Tax=Streptomyces sp. NPDC057543 TaxID=3346163 RepID=UPI00367FD641
MLPAEHDYTRALSMSRLAYDLENLFIPALAAALLSLVTYNWLFAGTSVGFLAFAALVVSCVLPKPAPVEHTGRPHTKAASGLRLFWVPRLRALLALDLAFAASGAMITVNTVVLVRDHLHRTAGDVSLARGAYGAGSMAAALTLPRILKRVSDRAVMLPAAFALPVVFAAYGIATSEGPSWPALLAAWTAFGAACSAVLTPTGRLIRCSAASADLPAAFAARFSLSHSCWLLTYPLAGWVASAAGTVTVGWMLGAIAMAGTLTAVLIWPAPDMARLDHRHHHLPPGHPHLAEVRLTSDGYPHSHDYVIDHLHPYWPAMRRTARP